MNPGAVLIGKKDIRIGPLGLFKGVFHFVSRYTGVYSRERGMQGGLFKYLQYIEIIQIKSFFVHVCI